LNPVTADPAHTAAAVDPFDLDEEGRHLFGVGVLRMAGDLTAARRRVAELEIEAGALRRRVANQKAVIGQLRRAQAAAGRDDAALRMVERIDRETAEDADDDEGAAHVCGPDCRSGGDEPKPVRPEAASAGARGWGRWLRWSR